MKKIKIMRAMRHPLTRAVLQAGDVIEIKEFLAIKLVRAGLAELVDEPRKGGEKLEKITYEKEAYNDEVAAKDEIKETVPKKEKKK